MAWQPSQDRALQMDLPNPFWVAIESIFDAAVPLDPLPRGDFGQLDLFYARNRKGDIASIQELYSRLPAQMSSIRMGASDLDLVDFILSTSKHRILRLVGPRGVGKTTMIHFAEAVIRQSCLEECPQLVVLNGLRCPLDASYEDLIGLLSNGLDELAQTAPGEFAEALEFAVTLLKRTPTLSCLGQAVAGMVMRLPRRDTRLLTTVFDNLDQLKSPAIMRVIEIAKSIYISSGLGSIICLRPGSEEFIARNSTASAFFFYRMELQTPRLDSWLECLVPRLVHASELRHEERGGHSRVEDVLVTPKVLDEAFARLLQLLREQRRVDDDVFEVLETVSANDTRHLIRLFRRLLRSTNLPYRWLLTSAQDRPAFHPLTSMIVGSKVFYEHNPDLPNLLYFNSSTFGIDFLLPHRILRLLTSSRNPITTERILQWLSQFGTYDTTGIIECCSMLLVSHVIGSTDSESISPSDPFPTALFLTDAGRYYVDKVLGYTDYLTSVVVDVPLDHIAMREHGHDTFAARLNSLVEYATEVKHAESRQLRELARRGSGSDLSRVVQSLSNGSLLSYSVLQGLSGALARGRASRSQSVLEMLTRVEAMIAEIEGWLPSAEKALRELRNKSGRTITVPTQPVLIGEEGVEAELNVKTVGEDLQMSVNLRGELSGTTFVAVTGLNQPTDFLQATPVNAGNTTGGPVAEGVLHGNFPDVTPGFALKKDDIHLQVLQAPPFLERVGLLTVNEDNGKARVCLYTGHELDPDIGSNIEMQKLRTWAVDQLDLISSLITEGQPFSDYLRAIGTELCNLALSPDGTRKLASSLNLIDTIVFCCNETEIPWELLCPPPTETETLPSIGDAWRVFRWPTDPADGAVKYMVCDPRARSGSLRTIGLSKSDFNGKHLASPPRSIHEIAQVAADCDSLHLVGHWDDGKLKFRDTNFRLDASLVRAFPIPGARSVVLSSCGAGAVDKSASLPIALSLRSRGKRVVWSPMVKLREEDAQQIDSYLFSFMESYPDVPLEELIREGRKTLPLLALYVRYGLSRA